MQRMMAVFLGTLLFLLSISSAFAAPAFVNKVGVSGNDVTTLSTAATSHTAANLLAVCVETYNAGTVRTVSTVTNTASDTFTQLVGYTWGGSSDARLEIWYICPTAGNASDVVQVTLTGQASYFDFSVYQFSGIASSSCPDQGASSGNNGSGTNASSTASSTTVADEVIFGCFQFFGTPPLTEGSGFTEGLAHGALGFSEMKIVSATGSYNATATQGSSAAWGAIHGTFKAPTAAEGYFTESNIQ